MKRSFRAPTQGRKCPANNKRRRTTARPAPSLEALQRLGDALLPPAHPEVTTRFGITRSPSSLVLLTQTCRLFRQAILAFLEQEQERADWISVGRDPYRPCTTNAQDIPFVASRITRSAFLYDAAISGHVDLLVRFLLQHDDGIGDLANRTLSWPDFLEAFYANGGAGKQCYRQLFLRLRPHISSGIQMARTALLHQDGKTFELIREHYQKSRDWQAVFYPSAAAGRSLDGVSNPLSTAIESGKLDLVRWLWTTHYRDVCAVSRGRAIGTTTTPPHSDDGLFYAVDVQSAVRHSLRHHKYALADFLLDLAEGARGPRWIANCESLADPDGIVLAVLDARDQRGLPYLPRILGPQFQWWWWWLDNCHPSETYRLDGHRVPPDLSGTATRSRMLALGKCERAMIDEVHRACTIANAKSHHRWTHDALLLGAVCSGDIEKLEWIAQQGLFGMKKDLAEEWPPSSRFGVLLCAAQSGSAEMIAHLRRHYIAPDTVPCGQYAGIHLSDAVFCHSKGVSSRNKFLVYRQLRLDYPSIEMYGSVIDPFRFEEFVLCGTVTKDELLWLLEHGRPRECVHRNVFEAAVKKNDIALLDHLYGSFPLPGPTTEVVCCDEYPVRLRTVKWARRKAPSRAWIKAFRHKFWPCFDAPALEWARMSDQRPLESFFSVS
jgi:hypothetical protein